MGDYTAIYLVGTPKPEFLPMWEALLAKVPDDQNCERWQAIAAKFPQFPFLAEWSKMSRADFIPFGHCWHDEWEDIRPKLEGGNLTFACSLKNYEQELDTWARLFGPTFADIETALILTPNFYYEDCWGPVPWENVRIGMLST